MSTWSLPRLLMGLHEDVERRLGIIRGTVGHSVAKGDASEGVWLDLLRTYLPKRYTAASAHVVDSEGAFSDQIDVVVFDQQYSPFIFHYHGQIVIPAESVYAVFECKQVVDSSQVDYAQKKVASVRRLCRTSLPIPHAGGTYPPKPLPYIFGGLLAFDSRWDPKLGEPLADALCSTPEGRLDIGCVAAHGIFTTASDGTYTITPEGRPATAFLFRLISLLQSSATAPMIDIQAYARWLVV